MIAQVARRPEATWPAGVAAEAQLFSGGLGGLGLLTARLLAQRGGGSRLVLSSRSGRVQAGSEADWAWVADSGASVERVRCDVSDEASAAALARSVLGGPWRLGGVFHAAGVLSDAALANQTPLRFRAVLGPKVGGGSSLHAASLTAGALRTFVVYSSMAGLMGSAGQSPHSAANAWLLLPPPPPHPH